MIDPTTSLRSEAGALRRGRLMPPAAALALATRLLRLLPSVGARSLLVADALSAGAIRIACLARPLSGEEREDTAAWLDRLAERLERDVGRKCAA